MQRFLDAALELMSSSENKDFTVQQVVERSGQSLRSFYQYFAGKYELLLALFEESVRSTAEHLADTVEPIEDPLDKLRAFLVEYYRICTPTPKGKPAPKRAGPNPAAIAEFAQQLLTEHPREAAEAFNPLVSLLEGCSSTPPVRACCARTSTTGGSPASCCRRSCSTPSRRRSAARRCAKAAPTTSGTSSCTASRLAASASTAERGQVSSR